MSREIARNGLQTLRNSSNKEISRNVDSKIVATGLCVRIAVFRIEADTASSGRPSIHGHLYEHVLQQGRRRCSRRGIKDHGSTGGRYQGVLQFAEGEPEDLIVVDIEL